MATEGTTRVYLSSRSVRGWPYLAEATLVAHRRHDGTLVWRPTGPRSHPTQFGVPSSWYRQGTKRAREASERFAGAPRPWQPVQD
jgi:hypothetical protein